MDEVDKVGMLDIVHVRYRCLPVELGAGVTFVRA